MTRDEFIGFLESVGAHYETCDESNPEAVDVYYDYGEKLVDSVTGETVECIPSIRVTGFGSDKLHVKEGRVLSYTRNRFKRRNQK